MKVNFDAYISPTCQDYFIFENENKYCFEKVQFEHVVGIRAPQNWTSRDGDGVDDPFLEPSQRI